MRLHARSQDMYLHTPVLAYLQSYSRLVDIIVGAFDLEELTALAARLLHG
jgi:hypothetical protein